MGAKIMIVKLTRPQIDYIKRSLESDLHTTEVFFKYIAGNKSQKEVKEMERKQEFYARFYGFIVEQELEQKGE